MYSLRKWATREEARNAVIDFIERRYNRNRPHSTIDYKVPAEVMDAFFERTKPVETDASQLSYAERMAA
jgi:transposase InsO family protein